MLNRRGQQYSVFQLLQAGIIAATMLVIVFQVVTSIQHQVPSSDEYTISAELLASAYSAAGTGEYFTRQAMLVDQEFEAESLKSAAGLPLGKYPTVGIICRFAYCIYDGEPLTGKGVCSSTHTACPSMKFVAGDKIDVCAVCADYERCFVFFGESEC